jgi:hypothetical protein
MIVTRSANARTQFFPSWAGLQITVNGIVGLIASVPSGQELILAAPGVGQFLNPVPLVPNRETVYQAFVNNLQNKITGLSSPISRVPADFAKYSVEQTPVMWVEQVGEHPSDPGRGMPYAWTFDVAVGLYVFVGDSFATPPVTLLNPILDQLEAAMSPASPGGRGLTLDGLVYETRLISSSKEAAGAIVDRGWAYVPAVIRVQ